MENDYWRYVIKCWLNESKFIDPFLPGTVSDIEKTNIKQVFSKFYEMIGAPPVDQNDVVKFVKDNYPDFDVKVDSEGQLCPSDFVYIYSLLLHFSCVKKADERFQEICKKLPSNVQEAIAVFFRELVQNDTLRRENIDKAMKKIVWENPCYLSESPVNSPCKNNASPQTPKTLLDAKTREMHVLKAQLETERYEKSVLESQVDEYEKQTHKLLEMQKSAATEIKKLQNELYLNKYERDSSISVQFSRQDFVVKSLSQEVSQQAVMILDLQQKEMLLNTEITQLQEKLSEAAEANRNHLSTNAAMGHTINMLEEESKKKDFTIQSLEESNKELERYVREMRGTKTDDLNSTEDFDFSIHNTSLSSGSLRSPENLACSVIDVQLKEKEQENTNLREKISAMENNEQKICEDIYNFIESLVSVNLPISIDSAEFNLNEGVSSLTSITMTIKKMFENAYSAVETLKSSTFDTCQELKDKLDSLKPQLEKLQRLLCLIEEGTDILFKENGQLKQSLQEKLNNVRELEHRVCALNCEKEQASNKNKLLQQEIDKLNNFTTEMAKNWKNKQGSEKALETRVKDMEQSFYEIQQNVSYFEEIIGMYVEEKQITQENFEQIKNELMDRCSHLEEERKSYSNKLIENQNVITNLQHSLEDITNKLKNLEKEKETLIEQIETLTKNESLKDEPLNSQKEIQASEDRIKELESKKAILKIQNETLAQQYHDKNHECDNLLLKCSTLEVLLQRLEEENQKKSEKLTQAENEIIVLQQNLQSVNEDKKTIKENMQKDIGILKAKLIKKRQLIEERERKWNEDAQKILEFEDRTRATRLEFDGKLEKMKEKMTKIYNEEVDKITRKHSQAMDGLQNKIVGLSAMNTNYEKIIQNLSQQISHLNDYISMSKRENPFLQVDSKESQSRPANTNRQRATSNQVMNADLKMEDEEGEIFDNTYLTDLKTGRTSPFLESISVRELVNRNSVCPPHLRSTYAAQYSGSLREDDLKEPNLGNLDDSLLSLLPTGTRKKSGTTSYKRPGPPTPSKHASRLSLGSFNVGHSRQVLTEFSENDNVATSGSAAANPTSTASRRTTPSRLRAFFSTKHRDESLTPRRRLSNLFKKK